MKKIIEWNQKAEEARAKKQYKQEKPGKKRNTMRKNNNIRHGQQNEESRDSNKKWVLEEIEKASQKGIPVIINDTCYEKPEPKELSMILETGSYMQEYVGDEKGKIIGIAFYQLRH